MKTILAVVSLISFAITTNVYAEGSKLDRKQIDSLSPSDRAAIESILKQNRLLESNRSISKPEDFKGFLGLPDITIPDPRKEICKAACDVSLGAAMYACSTLSGGTAIAACSAAALVARDSCKNGC